MDTQLKSKVLCSAISSRVISLDDSEVLKNLANESDSIAIAKSFDDPKLLRRLQLSIRADLELTPSDNIVFDQHNVFYKEQIIGQIKILYKAPIPGELQARLATESIIDRFLDYLQKVYKIIVLHESDHHVQVFIPDKYKDLNFSQIWQEFLKQVVFSDYDKTQKQLPALVQTFIVMLRSVTLSDRGFSTLDIPILTQEQGNVLAGWYYAVIKQVKTRQDQRQQRIDYLKNKLEDSKISEKEQRSVEKEIQDKEAMQLKEKQKYFDTFGKSFSSLLEQQDEIWKELEKIEKNLNNSSLSKRDRTKILKERDKLLSKVIFSQDFIRQKKQLFISCLNNPFEFIQEDDRQNPDKFKSIKLIAQSFDKKATEQINSTRGDIFTQCLTEMYRLIELPSERFDALPPSLLTEHPPPFDLRSPGDDSKEFCYSCGTALDPKTAKWQVLRFMFERPSQRRQSASGEGRPYICSSCAALAFASPLKVTDESIILQLELKTGENVHYSKSTSKLKDYLRMLTTKELHLSSGRYLILTSDRTKKGDLASQKLGQVQYALAKVASIFPQEVLSDYEFSLIDQGNISIPLKSRHLLFIKGVMDGYSQAIVIAGKDINMHLGDAVRYLQQDFPFLAEYELAKNSNYANRISLEKVRQAYRFLIEEDLKLRNESMDSKSELSKRARLYRDVAALTGICWAFVQSLESTAKKSMSTEDAVREVSKIIEKVDDATAFCYYATLGDETKRSVQARLYLNPDNSFVYSEIRNLFNQLNISDREMKDDQGKQYLQFYAEDISRIYMYFANENDYKQDKGWKELTYNLKLSLYTRFPELVRKLKSKTEN